MDGERFIESTHITEFVYSETYNDHVIGYLAAGHLDEPQKAEIVNKCKLVRLVFIKTHWWINHR